MAIKNKKILDGMVTLNIHGFRNFEGDNDTTSLALLLKEKTGRKEDSFMYLYAEKVVYTESINFNWLEEAPEEYRNLETFWGMILDGTNEVECYLYYVKNISNVVTNAWHDAVEKAHEIWKPPQEKNAKLAGIEEQTDPN